METLLITCAAIGALTLFTGMGVWALFANFQPLSYASKEWLKLQTQITTRGFSPPPGGSWDPEKSLRRMMLGQKLTFIGAIIFALSFIPLLG